MPFFKIARLLLYFWKDLGKTKVKKGVKITAHCFFKSNHAPPNMLVLHANNQRQHFANIKAITILAITEEQGSPPNKRFRVCNHEIATSRGGHMMLMWIFGYGSLIWKADFPYEKKLCGYITGYLRRFWQASEDHRGVPGRPGRVVTLVPSEDQEDKVWGVAYKINDDIAPSVASHLDFREKDGYEKKTVMFYPVPCPPSAATAHNVMPSEELPDPFTLCVYIATKENSFYAGEADIKSIACQICGASGPSGTNTEYLLRLADATRTLFPECKDAHLFDLEAAVLQIMNKHQRP